MSQLKHFGILGMQWGVRKGPTSKIKLSKKKTKASPEHSVKKLSDNELRTRINRIQMERQYSQLTTAEKHAGQKFAEDIFVNAAKTTATAFVALAMKKAVMMAIKNALN